MTDCLIDWFMLIDWLTDWLIYFDWLINYLHTAFLTICSPDWLIDWLLYLHTGSLTLCRSDVVTGSPLPASFTAITLNSISDPSFRPPTVNVVSLDGWLLTGAQSPRLPLFSTTYPVNNIIIHWDDHSYFFSIKQNRFKKYIKTDFRMFVTTWCGETKFSKSCANVCPASSFRLFR